MTHQVKNRIKALFLLVVFSLNTLVGFACSVGVDMGYNHNHHHDENLHHKHSDNDGTNHKRQHMLSTVGVKDAHSMDDCCSSDVTKFALLDKSVVDNNLHLGVPVFLLGLTITFPSPTINESGLAANSTFQFARRSSFLNDTDIQTTIRRFQI